MRKRKIHELREMGLNRLRDIASDKRGGRRMLRYVNGLRQHQVGRAAGAMAFYFFFASLPLLAAMAWMLAAWLVTPSDHVDSVLMFLDLAPLQVRGIVQGQIAGLTGSKSSVAPIVIFSAVWLAASALQTVMGVLEQAVYAAPRGFWKKRFIALGSALILIAGLPIAGALIVWLAAPVDFLNALLGIEDRTRAGKIAALVVALLMVWVAFAGFFRVAVSRPYVRRRVWWGALLTVVLSSGASYLLSHFFGVLGQFSTFFGSLATVSVLLAWLWICSIAILMGAELNAQLEGLERPLWITKE